MRSRQAFLATTAAVLVATLLFLTLRQDGSSRAELIRAYGLLPIVEAMDTSNEDAVLGMMQTHNLCRPVREPPQECADANYVDAVRIWGPLLTPNLRSAATMREWLRASLDSNTATLAFISSSVEGDDNRLFLLFRLEEARSAIPGHGMLDVIAA